MTLPGPETYPLKKIAIFASGTGTNAQKIIDHFRGNPTISIALIASNKPDAGVLDIARKEKIPTLLIEREKFFRGNAYTNELQSMDICMIENDLAKLDSLYKRGTRYMTLTWNNSTPW